MKKITLTILTLFLFIPATILGQTKEELKALERILDKAVEERLKEFCSNTNKQLPIYLSECEWLSSVIYVGQIKTMVMNYNISKKCRFRHKEVAKTMAKVKSQLIGDMFFNKKEIKEDAKTMVDLMDTFDIKFKMVYRNEKSSKILGFFFVNYNDIINEFQKRNPKTKTL
ncbi:MAG: hypothetical protein K2O66_03720 [Bacteroidales bacterium]|nr:hypothetical protein [Bacteroidales bacterium]MDE7072459.1 hypothetical protein [Bacteroidales bacterium]